MGKQLDHEENKLDITPMIDVIFLLIIFFILMPAKEMDWRLEAHLPPQNTDPEKSPIPPKISPTYHIHITSKNMGHDEIISYVYFNQRPVCEFVTFSLTELERIYSMPSKVKEQKLQAEHQRDEQQFHPSYSNEIRNLIQQMNNATLGTEKEKGTKIIIDSTPNVPFKIVLAVLNAATGAGYSNIGFSDPGKEIWQQN